MLLENNLKKYKEAPEAIKQMVGLVGLTTLIIFTFIFLNIFFNNNDKYKKDIEEIDTYRILKKEITEKLTKTYSNQLKALIGVNLKVEKGDFFALLGSNGAGKTTAIGIICGLLKSTSGSVEINGLEQKAHVNKIKRMIGLMPQEFNFNPHEPNIEILINQAGYFGIARTEAKIQAEKLLKKMELWDRRFDVAQSLSGGMKRRLMLARALMHEPEILILDEPTAGVDLEIRQSM